MNRTDSYISKAFMINHIPHSPTYGDLYLMRVATKAYEGIYDKWFMISVNSIVQVVGHFNHLWAMILVDKGILCIETMILKKNASFLRITNEP